MRVMTKFERDWFLSVLPIFVWVVILCLALGACVSAPVDRPCGVITDSLKDVQGKTPADTRRIDIHYERGGPRGARCWQ